MKIEQLELDAIRAALLYEDNVQAADGWLSDLIGRIRDGIDRGTYTVIPTPPSRANDPEESMRDHPYVGCVRSLFLFEPQEGDAIWVDDRFVNGYYHRDGIPIIGINEILKALVNASALSTNEYYEILSRQRAANIRFIPIETGEILFYLQHARIEGDAVVETRHLSVLRRYVATCLLHGGWLQRPTSERGVPNQEGETAFVLGLSHAIDNALVEIWNTEEDTRVCEARSNWIISNLFLDHLGLLTLTSLQRPDQDDRYVVGVSLAGLISRALLLQSDKDRQSSSPRKRYLDWLYVRVLHNRIVSDPLLPATIADFLKKSMSESREELRPSGHEWITLGLIQEFFEDLPQPIREEIGRDSGFMASIGFRSTLDVAGVRFDPGVYWRAAADAINGRETSIRAIKPKTIITFEPQHSIDEQIAFCFEHPVTGQKVPVGGIDYQLLLESPAEQEKFLLQNRAWFDCPKEILEQAIAEIISTEDPAQRVEKVTAWRRSSAAVYYEDLDLQIRNDNHFDPDWLIPPSAPGLLRHFRLTIESSPDSSSRDALATATEALIQQEGLQIAIERLARLPVPLPQPIFDAAALLHPNEIHTIVRNLVRQPGSSLSQIHCVHLLSQLGNKRLIYRRLARRIIARLSSAEGIGEFEAFSTILRWVNARFHYWPDVQTWPAHVRLAMVWAHSHQLFAIFSSAGAPIAWMIKTFSQLGNAIVSEVFGRDLTCWFDIAHPRRVGRAPFVLTGLVYAIGEDSVLTGDEQLRQLFDALAFHYIDGRKLPDLFLLQDVTRATNSLGSFLGGDRAEALSKLLTADDASSFTRQSLKTIVEGAVDTLEQANTDLLAWATIYAVLGDFAPNEDLTDRLRSIISQTKFADLFVENWHLGNLALQAAASQIYYSGDDVLYQYLTSELIRIAKLIAAHEATSTGAIDEDNPTLAETEGFLFEAALKISLANSVPANAPAFFCEIVTKMVDDWPNLGSTAMIVVQQLYERLPILQAKQFSVLLVRLRALNAHALSR